MRFYLDENMPPQIAIIARAAGLDVVSTHELGHHGLADDAVLRLAALDGRCVVTRDRDDYLELTVRFSEQG
jgi:predicted nuclease of predicted toxin-antitoxin system